MPDDLHDGIVKWLSYTRPLIEKTKVYIWEGPDADQYFQFLQRAAVMRQTESVQALIEMDESDFAHFGVTFLRPAYEEIIWIEHLKKHQNLASEIVRLIGFNEVTGSIAAQSEFFGTKAMNSLGFTQKAIKYKSRKTVRDKLA